MRADRTHRSAPPPLTDITKPEGHRLPRGCFQPRPRPDGFEPGGAPPPLRLDGAPPAAPSLPLAFTGFDDHKLEAPLKLQSDGQPASAKYTFAKLAQAAGNMPASKAGAEAWFNEHIKPGLEAAGFGVDWVQGDKALIRTRENPGGEVVDFVRGAGSEDPSYIALAWQSEGPSSDSTAPSSPAFTFPLSLPYVHEEEEEEEQRR